MMVSKAMRDAMLAAQTFLARCADVHDEEMRVVQENKDMKADGHENWRAYASRVPHAAAKRASMDLTRALAKMRKPGAI